MRFGEDGCEEFELDLKFGEEGCMQFQLSLWFGEKGFEELYLALRMIGVANSPSPLLSFSLVVVEFLLL